ncbi:alcohol dehydrogenase catalytic domain-containing protein [Acidianus sp. RZ1]|uniref:alcohol dehydrogenase catalytic domain-containing protein n=1 Tax=Acidianus sp. RZ1 TaxID=1540082 RepID=UPI0014928AF6|nr:alcohol dehydrogenase catalytic domain-containing protein [Acidianus sp. RZ1]NON62081.1 alcohol dehydrogenase catalytic domain-containing protein [Acidianus sp. RZ1]
MKALLFDGKGIGLKDVNLEGEYEVKAVGICGTDIAVLNGTYKPRKLPIVLGHEFCIENNKRIYTAEINIVDWSCDYCKRGMYTHCRNRKAIGIDVDGAMRERITLPDYLLHQNVYGLSEVELALTEPTAAVLRMIELVKPSPD